MAEELPEVSVGEFETVLSLLASNESLQIAFAILVIGLIIIITVYRKFSQWVQKQKFNYTRPHLSRFARKAVLPFFAIALVSSTNAYIQVFQLFEEEEQIQNPEGDPTAQETFAKILNTINILVIGYTVSHLIPIALNKRDKSVLEREDFEQWMYLRGFPDDEGNFFHKLFKWTAPKQAPEDMSDEAFQKFLQSESGKHHLERYRTSTGHPVGSYEQLDDHPFEKWKQSERKKYLNYYEVCIIGKNQAGRVLRPGVIPSEIYPIDNWREQKRIGEYGIIIPGARPPGYARKKSKEVPKSAKQILPIGIFIATILGVATWWGIDLVVLATATGGMALGIGLALKETMENYFAYILIRKDKVFKEGDRVQLQSG
ncbi:MAG: mechanosensitive ion channel, partial [Thaumarchaeota archaeon]|nr:mechanosensitive ion channel [Nitrososphaerota archaeon]